MIRVMLEHRKSKVIIALLTKVVGFADPTTIDCNLVYPQRVEIYNDSNDFPLTKRDQGKYP